MTEKALALQKLIHQLQLAYSGERAAALAYRGHWRSLRDVETRDRIRQIEEEEWHHRALVGRMLKELGKKPRLFRELRAFLIGRVLGLLCHVSGRFLPMYGAGKLERKNVKEYEVAARHAVDSGHPEYVDCLLLMAEVEWDHEKFFRAQVEGHSWLSMFPLWPPLPPKEQIRTPLSSDKSAAILTEGFSLT
ncbi:MAG: ferritin-like domain-containing protein [Planctomycetes bacterium]|nr:ferritin-like domain-containing protein [Planctomycetota bacterium]